jgi:phosphoglycerate dehydrogenase-like enzyme
MSKIKIGLTGGPEGYANYLEEKGFEVFFRPWISQDEDDCIRRLKGMDAALAASDPFSARVLDVLSDSLKLISRLGVGVDAIDLKHSGELGIAVCNTPGMLSVQVAEHTLALLLSLYKKIPSYDKNVRAGNWKALSAHSEIGDKTVGFVGFGAIAQQVSKYLAGFNCSLTAYDPHFNSDAAKKLGVTEVSIDEMFSKADIVSLHLPVTPDTVGMVNKDFFSKMKKEAVIINTSRGPIINEADLVEALRNKTIAGAALDVMETEPPEKENPLYSLENVVLTPHCAWNTIEGSWRVAKEAAERVFELRDGREIKNVVNANFLKGRKT